MAAEETVPDSGCSRITAGVDRTLAEGSADVDVVIEYSLPAEPADGPVPTAMSTRCRGVVDFGSDRATLTSDYTSLMLDGSVRYQAIPGGRWTHQAGRAGQWDSAHPRWALEVLRAGCRSAEPVSGPDVVAELDRDRAADLTPQGLSPDWQTLRASTTFDDAGRLHRVEITMTGSARPDAWMSIAAEFTGFNQAAAQIDVPADSVDLADYLGPGSLGQ
ncbi:MAG: hypothetical protein GEU83_12480 [Pseudonocardiaceae bacterium]|nr:hypothetical protein [Pseudonocardiaceae bacterium]